MTFAGSLVRVLSIACLALSALAAGGTEAAAAGSASQLPGPVVVCNGTPGQWAGCRGNGCAVCAELVADYPLYFEHHPLCSPNYTCGGRYFTCNQRCHAPTEADRCDATPGDVNLNGMVGDIGDVVLLESFLACQAELTPAQIANSDVNGDCLVDQSDADYLLDYIGGGPAPLPCACLEPVVTGCRCSSPGDVNLNGLAGEIGDVVLLSNFLACEAELTPEQIVNADVNGDCMVDNADLDYLLAYIGGGPAPFPCACPEPTVTPCRCSSPGDVNLNGLAGEIGDVVLLSNFLACEAELTPEQIRNADVNGDCAVDNADLDYLLAYIGGGPAPLPCAYPEPAVTGCRCSSPGDVNLNGMVGEIGDAVLLSNFLGCEAELTPEQIVNANVDGNCVVDNADLDYLLAYIGGGPAPLPCACPEPTVTGCRCSSPGDTNGNGIVADIGDVIYLGNFLCQGGPAPNPLANGNVDGDCDIDLTDYYRLLDIVVYGGEPAPCVCGEPTVLPCE